MNAAQLTCICLHLRIIVAARSEVCDCNSQVLSRFERLEAIKLSSKVDVRELALLALEAELDHAEASLDLRGLIPSSS